MTALQQWPHYSDPVLHLLMFWDESKDGSVSKAAFTQQTHVVRCWSDCWMAAWQIKWNLILSNQIWATFIFAPKIKCRSDKTTSVWTETWPISEISETFTSQVCAAGSHKQKHCGYNLTSLESLIHSRQDLTTPGSDSASTHSSAQKEQLLFHREPRLHLLLLLLLLLLLNSVRFSVLLLLLL